MNENKEMTNQLHERVAQFEHEHKENNALCPPFPKIMLLEVTNACNDKCIFCANSKTTRRKRFIDLELATSVLRQAYELGTREVGFYATGEPLLYKDLERVVCYAKDLGYTYTYITTNGALLDEERARSLIAAGIDSVKVSMNATNERDYQFVHGTGDYANVLANIKNFDVERKKSSHHVNLFLSCVMTKQTIKNRGGNYKKVLEIIKKYVDDICVENCINLGGMMPEAKVLGSMGYAHDDDICPYPFKEAQVSVEGYLTMCCTDFQNYLAVADLHKESLASAWVNEYAVKLRKMLLV